MVGGFFASPRAFIFPLSYIPLAKSGRHANRIKDYTILTGESNTGLYNVEGGIDIKHYIVLRMTNNKHAFLVLRVSIYRM